MYARALLDSVQFKHVLSSLPPDIDLERPTIVRTGHFARFPCSWSREVLACLIILWRLRGANKLAARSAG